MDILGFEIRDFKGIDYVKIQLAGGAPGNVITLVGLNESGKTTILEAMARFVTRDKDTANLVETVQPDPSLQDLIPKDKKAAFSGVISIKAWVKLSPDEIAEVEKLYSDKYKLQLGPHNLHKAISVTREYRFTDSRHTGTSSVWSPVFPLKAARAKNFKTYTSDEKQPEMRTAWLAGIDLIESMLPKIVYFPTFLFDFPDRIYLQGEHGELNAYYVKIIQDVLDSAAGGLSVQKHIVDRIERLRDKHTIAATFLAYLFGQDEKKQIDAVLQSAALEMSRVIFGAWNRVLGKPATGKRVHIEWLLDAEKDNAPYLEISIVDGLSTYSLAERSLGFRWFFSFLLFTEFRKNRVSTGGTVFLFDEPAANLHSRAQIKLLESFARIVTGRTYIIYSTHSHYMVNPIWLEGTYIVENSASAYDNEDDAAAMNIKRVNIQATKYKEFVGSHPNQTTYFQPVLDALQIPISPLVAASSVIIVEGKFDFYPLRYFMDLKGVSNTNLFPGNGASGLAPLVAIFRGWGVDFKVILDDDAEGRSARERYLGDLLLRPDEIVTIGEINSDAKGKSIESLFKTDLRTVLMAQFNTNKLKKQHFGIHFQELVAKNLYKTYPDTQAAFDPLVEWIRGANSPHKAKTIA